MIRILLAILCVLVWGSAAHAQALQRVTNCGDGNPPAGASPGTQDATGKTCVSGTATLSGALPAGTNIIGQVGIDQTTPGTTNGVTTTPNSANIVGTPVTQTVTNAAYASGNAVGGLISFAAVGASGYIQKLVFNLPDAQTPTLDVVFFNANPSGSTITDKSAIVIAAADQAKMIGVAHISDCTGYSTPTSCQAQNLAIPYSLASGTTIWAAVVARSAFTPSNLPIGSPAWALLFTTVR